MGRGGAKRRQHAQRAYCRLKIGNEYQTKKTIAGPFRVGYGLSVWLYSGFCVGLGETVHLHIKIVEGELVSAYMCSPESATEEFKIK